MTDYWRPETLDDLRSFIDNGLASESRLIEFKQELPLSRGENRALARQLAAFAIEGGAVVIGVTEEAENQFNVVPIPVAGLRERVEQIAQSVVEPPLWVESRILADDGESGVLWIDVPQSPDALHQVDGTYYERGDTQVRPMSDAAVERLMRSRSSSLDDIRNHVHEVLRDDPFADRPWARTCVVARPVGAEQQALYDASGGQAGWEEFAARLKGAQRIGNGSHSQLSLLWLIDGWGALATTRREHLPSAPDPRRYCSLTLSDDGSVHLLTSSQSLGHEAHLQPGRTIAACLDVLAVLRYIASKTGKRWIWDLAVGITHTKDLRATTLRDRTIPSPPPPLTPLFRDEGYARALRIAGARLEGDPWGIARDLTQRFVEGCGLDFEGEARVLGYEP